MVWNDIISWVNNNFAEIGVAGIALVESIKLITNRLNFNKVYTATVAPIQTSNSVVFKKVTEAIALVDKLARKVDELTTAGITKDKQIEMLSDLVVTTLAIANVPTSAKQDFFNVISKAKVVSDDASLVLLKMIEAKQRQDATVVQQSDEAIQALTESEV